MSDEEHAHMNKHTTHNPLKHTQSPWRILCFRNALFNCLKTAYIYIYIYIYIKAVYKHTYTYTHTHTLKIHTSTHFPTPNGDTPTLMHGTLHALVGDPRLRFTYSDGCSARTHTHTHTHTHTNTQTPSPQARGGNKYTFVCISLQNNNNQDQPCWNDCFIFCVIYIYTTGRYHCFSALLSPG